MYVYMYVCVYVCYVRMYVCYVRMYVCVAPQIASPYLTLAMAYEEIGDMDKHYQVSSLCSINTQ